MRGTFACPECGAELKPKSVGPARQVLCDYCLTLVEVPFFPRATSRPKRRPGWAAQIGWGAAALAVLSIAGIGFCKLVGSFSRPVQKHTAYKVPFLSRSEAETRLAAIEASAATDPGQAVVGYQALLDLVRLDEMQVDLADRIQQGLSTARRRGAEADLSAAHAVATADPNRAVTLCEQVLQTAAELPPGSGSQLRDQAWALASQVAERVGVNLPPTVGRFRLGSDQTYKAALHEILIGTLRQRGYVPVAQRSPLASLWNERAPYRMTVDVVEEQNDVYLQSQNRISRIEAQFILSRSGAMLWQTRLTTRTQVPLPNLRVQEATRLAIGTVRNPEVERRFYKDALNTLVRRLGQKIRDLPVPLP